MHALWQVGEYLLEAGAHVCTLAVIPWDLTPFASFQKEPNRLVR